MVMLKSTVEEAVTVERENDPWELPVREAVLVAREHGRTAVVVVHSWQLNQDSLADFEAVGVNGNGGCKHFEERGR
jgi:hypothetical protein